MNKTVKNLTTVALMAAILCILGPLSLPIGLVPISLATLGIYFTIYVLGMKRATVSCAVYLLIGLIGIPVYSGMTSGPGKLLGPTGGYLIGYLFLAIIGGFFVDKFFDKWYLCLLGLIISTAVLYAIGTCWLAVQAHMTAGAALMAGVIPFIPGDLAKIVIAVIAGPMIRKRLSKAELITY